MAMMMTGRVLLVCALCVLWCGARGIHARNPDSNSLGGHMASRGFGRKKSFLSNGSIKNLSTPLLLSASFISAIQAEAREGVSSPGVNNLPLSGATVFSPAFSGLGASSPRPTVPGHGTPIPGAGISGADVSAHVPAIPGHVPATPGPAGHVPVGRGHGAAIPGVDVPIVGRGPVRGAAAPTPGVAVPSDGAFSGFGAAGLGAAGPGPLRDPAFPGSDAAANIPGSVVPGHGTPITGAADPSAAAFS
ncbi:mucin-associated surface protein (MASP), putative, partial [Trypanosoma cruzi]